MDDTIITNTQEQPMTKKQRRLLRKQQKEQDHLQLAKSRKVKKILAISLPAALIVGAVIFSLVNSSPQDGQSASGTPRMEINHKDYDFGNVLITGGLVKHTFEIKNTGSSDLEINGVWTSCHCTTAQLTVRDKTGPEYGMNSRLANQTIASGETGYLEVIFDPDYHGPQGIGPAVRVVYLTTNDPENKRAQVTFSANVVR